MSIGSSDNISRDTLKQDFRVVAEHWLRKANKQVNQAAIDQLFDKVASMFDAQPEIEKPYAVEQVLEGSRRIYKPKGFIAKRMHEYIEHLAEQGNMEYGARKQPNPSKKHHASRLKTPGMIRAKQSRVALESELRLRQHQVRYEDNLESKDRINKRIAEIESQLKKTGRQPDDVLDLVTHHLINGLRELGLSPDAPMLLKSVVRGYPYGLAHIVFAIGNLSILNTAQGIEKRIRGALSGSN